MTALKTALRIIDRINDTLGRWTSFMLIPLALAFCYEVISRKLFNAPTIWAHESTQYFYGALIAVGGAYALLHKGHVNVEVIYERFSDRKRAMVDALTSLLFFLFMGVALWLGTDIMIRSVKQLETSGTVWSPPVYPLKIMVVLGVLLMIAQGLAKLVRDLYLAFTGKELS